MALIFVGLMSIEHVSTYFLGFVTFAAASITDYYDGKIARARNIETNFGKLLDPVADKVLVVAAFIMLMTIEELRVPGWAIVLIIAREFLVTGLRALAAADGIVISANNWGKTKTVLQMVYVCTFLFFTVIITLMKDYPGAFLWLPFPAEYVTYAVGVASQAIVILVALYTVYSGIQFTRFNWTTLGLDHT